MKNMAGKAAINMAKKQMMKKVASGQQQAKAEIAKVKKNLDDTYKKVTDFAKKNPEKVALASAAVGAALAVAVSMLMGRKGGKRK